MKKYELQIADWARAEQRHKEWTKRRIDFFLHVRIIFFLLFAATILVFVHNYQVKVQSIASAGLNRAMEKPAALSNNLRENALEHEKEVDEINQPSGAQPEQP